MDIIFSIFKWIGIGFVGLIIFAFVFGKRIKKKWEYEAEFREEDFKEYGEFEVEMSKIEKEETDYTLKVEFYFRHESIRQHQAVQVFIDDLLVLEGLAEKDGYIRMGLEQLQNTVDEPLLDKMCRIVIGGEEIDRLPLKRD